MKKVSFIQKIRLFIHGYKIVQTKQFMIIWDRKTGNPVNWIIPTEGSQKLNLAYLSELDIRDFI